MMKHRGMIDYLECDKDMGYNGDRRRQHAEVIGRWFIKL